MRSRRHRPFYRFSMGLLGLLIIAISPLVGLKILELKNAMARSDLFSELVSGATLLGCVAAIFLLVWAMVALSKNKFRKSER